MPDWPAVCDDYDAVHLRVLGYLMCAGVALDLDDEAATVLAGWAPDATYWLDDMLESEARPSTGAVATTDWSPV